jgi:hypothetical protein
MGRQSTQFFALVKGAQQATQLYMDSNRPLGETRAISDASGNYFVENTEPINLVVPRFSKFLLNKRTLITRF